MTYSKTVGNKPEYNDTDIQDNNTFNNDKNSLPQPVSYNRVKIVDMNNNLYQFYHYTDCFEISLLRFLHLTFGEKEKINLDKLKTFMDNDYEKNELYQFFVNNQNYSNDSDYYVTKEGYDIRTKWCEFLNKRNFFTYVKDDNYEVCSSPENLVMFFMYFFPKMKLTDKVIDANPEEMIYKLFEYLKNFINYKVNVYTHSVYSDKLYANTTIKIFVNNNNLYEWEIYQYFNYDDEIIIESTPRSIKNRITGHTDFRYSKYV
jgi:hypothetical protein